MQTIAQLIYNSAIFPAVEFSLIISMIIMSYWALHVSKIKQLSPIATMTLSMFCGSSAYIISKVAIVTMFALTSNVNTSTAYVF
jgi:hypothetical protein